ncbi:MAG: phosphoribosylanthranilate isomerase, partial [Candidatus Eremiobacteraeota bacterium]|nr:phosphoribosylanthranilate isomerase [Candidatus Eremiobacteraeota bacterium]
MTIVKICGVRRLVDARAAVAAGADIVGFTFWPGTKRYIVPEDAAAVIAALRAEDGPRPLVSGLFVNADPATIAATVALCGLDLVQLSGDETATDVARFGVPLLKAVRALPGEDVDALRERIHVFHLAARSLPPGPFDQPLMPLLDAHVPGQYGGTGQTGDWALAAALAAEEQVLLAGGLTPENVADAVRIVRPWGVDVASGVEVAGQPGVKDAAR